MAYLYLYISVYAVFLFLVCAALCLSNKYKLSRGETICRTADGSSTRGGSTSVRGRVRSPHMAKLQAASVPIA